MSDRNLVTMIAVLAAANALVAVSRRTPPPSAVVAQRPSDATSRTNVLREQRGRAQERARARGGSTYVFETAVLPPAIAGR